MQQWERQLTYTILSDDPGSDTFRVNIYADPQISSTNPVAQVTLQEMEDFLKGWGATDITAASGVPGVMFQISAFDAIKSKGLFTFGDAEDEMMKYTELTYDAASGTHTVELDYSLSVLKQDQIKQVLDMCSATTIISIDDTKALCIFSANRTDMITALEGQVNAKFTKMIARVRWRFKDTTIMSALANGGVTQMLLSQIDDNIVDVATEV